jgi:Ca-activated chloride channel homolog
MMKDISFLNPEFLWLLTVIPVLIAWQIWQRRQLNASLKISSLKGFAHTGSFLPKLKPVLFIFRLLAIALIVVGIARPRKVDISSKTKTTKGVDIVLAIDVSGSMLARDLKPNRLDALKKVASEFVKERPNDRIGIVLYASEAYTKMPVTSDKEAVEKALSEVKFDRQLQDGTGIGMGLSTAVNRLKDSKAKSKIVILLTDGVNNAGFIEPETASDIAKEFGIKVYTIGLGSNGMAESPYAYAPNGTTLLYKMAQVEIEEKLMKSIAKKTGGKYFRATSNSRLKSIYDAINKLETTEIQELKFYDYDEKFRPLIFIACGLLVLEILLRKTVFRSFI